MYTITYLLLRNFKRFPLRDLEVFEHQFTSKILMITGPNGSGKSSLFNELTPLPSDKNNFNPQGYKEIHIKSDKHIYKLISDFTDGTSFSFIVDGEELNQSNNVTAQKDLVYQHFKITPAIHDLLVGKENFTDLSLLSRKKLFSSITHLNIDKVLENYNSLKEELKNNELVLKTQTSLLKSEESKLLDNSRLDTLKETQDRTREFIDFLLDMRSELTVHRSDYQQEDMCRLVKSYQDKIESMITKSFPSIVVYPAKDLPRYKLNFSSQLAATTNQLSNLYNQIESKQEELKILLLNQQSSLTSLLDKQTELVSKKNNYLNSLVFLKDTLTSHQDLSSSIYFLETTLPDILRVIPLNPDRQYTKEAYEKLLSIKQQALETLTDLISKERTLTKELDTLKTTDDTVSCPNCNHTWSLKDLPQAIEHTHKHLSEVLRQKLQVQETIKSTDKTIEDFTNYFNLYRQYSNARNSTHTQLRSFWEHIDQDRLVFTQPTKIITLVSQLNHELINLDEVNKINRELDQITKNITVLSNIKDNNIESVQNAISELEMIVDDLQSYKEYLNTTLKNIESIEVFYQQLEHLQNTLQSSITNLHSANLSFTTNALLDAITVDLSKSKVILIETQNQLNQYNNIQYTINKHTKVIEDIQSNIKVLTIILDELSPKNGLIAKSVSSFLNVIISNVNTTLSNIWEYKMVLKPINVENEALNYKFKVEVEDKLTIADIDGISRGMKEAVNWAFKIVLYKLLGLEGTPFFADELASNLDKTHTDKLMNLMHQLSLSDKYSQIFLITHKENLQFLRDCETLSLDS